MKIKSSLKIRSLVISSSLTKTRVSFLSIDGLTLKREMMMKKSSTVTGSFSVGLSTITFSNISSAFACALITFIRYKFAGDGAPLG